MVFSSSTFLLAFLPITLALYFIMPTRPAKNILLLAVSLLFYAWGEPVYVLLMVASILANWILAILIDRTDSHGRKRLLLIFNLIVNLGILGFFKYESFLAANINALLGFQAIPDLQLPLPIGISFFTLQAVSYVIDVYREEVPAQKNPLYLGMYISMFPQLIAGPIVRYQTIQDQVLNRRENLKDFSAGLRLFIVGLAKKVLLANTAAILATKMLDMGGENIGVIGAWAGLIAYTFQIFFDFSGYSDMAIGLGKMFGFKYLRNFNYPYISKSATEFWRRWHISLSTFFRDYVYIPLGGNRVSKLRWVFNICVVWALTGFWHGAAWNYIGWGVYYGAVLLLEKLAIGNALKKCPAFIQHVYCIFVFMFGWLIFWIEDANIFTDYLAALFGTFGATGTSTFWELTAWEYWPVFLACILASTPIVPWLRARIVAALQEKPFDKERFWKSDLPGAKTLGTDTLCEFETGSLSQRKAIIYQCICIAVDFILLALLIWSTLSVVSGSFNPFIYFRF